jgi:hypothetical protein
MSEWDALMSAFARMRHEKIAGVEYLAANKIVSTPMGDLRRLIRRATLLRLCSAIAMCSEDIF